MKMLVVEVGIDKITQTENYRLLYCSTAGGDKIPWNEIDQWWSKTDVESNCEPCGLIKGRSPLNQVERPDCDNVVSFSIMVLRALSFSANVVRDRRCFRARVCPDRRMRCVTVP
jgi:hypothetical protein